MQRQLSELSGKHRAWNDAPQAWLSHRRQFKLQLRFARHAPASCCFRLYVIGLEDMSAKVASETQKQDGRGAT